MITRLNAKAVLPLTLLFLGACGSGPKVKETYGPPPRAFEGFPAESYTAALGQQADVNVEASFVGKHQRMLGTDLTKKGILPIRLTLGLRGNQKNDAQIKLDFDQMNMRLYLSDGTVLSPASAEDVEKAAGKSNREKVIAHTLDTGILSEYSIALEKEQFVFFNLDLEDIKLDGIQLRFMSDKQTKNVNLSNSLLAFNVTFDRKLQPFTVGIKHK